MGKIQYIRQCSIASQFMDWRLPGGGGLQAPMGTTALPAPLRMRSSMAVPCGRNDTDERPESHPLSDISESLRTGADPEGPGGTDASF